MRVQEILQILHVEDHDLDAEAVLRTFRKLGVDIPVARAPDGAEALEMLRGMDSDAIRRTVMLLDLNLPRMSGLELLEQMRGDGELGAMRVFTFTTSESKEDRAAAQSFGIEGYIVKPAISRELPAALTPFRDFLRSA